MSPDDYKKTKIKKKQKRIEVKVSHSSAVKSFICSVFTRSLAFNTNKYDI